MNIFVFDPNPLRAARMHCNKHVCKMIIESAQMMSTAHHVLDGDSQICKRIYHQTHLNHPCTIWVRSCTGNYRWIYFLFKHLLAEYTHRYEKIHYTSRLINHLGEYPKGMPVGRRMTFVQAMPEKYKQSNPVKAYRDYFNGDKQHIAAWKKRREPKWFRRMRK